MAWICALKYYSQKTPTATAVITEGKKTTYAQLYEKAARLASFFRQNGLNRGDSLLCRSAQNTEYFITLCATLLAGAVFVPLDRDTSVESLSAVASQMNNVKIVVGEEKDRQPSVFFLPLSNIGQVLAQCPQLPYEEISDDDVAMVLFTTGTTGQAKGVVLPHRQLNQCDKLGEYMGYTAETVIYVSAAVNHYGFFVMAVNAVYRGGAFVISQGFTALRDLFDAIDKHGANAVFATVSGFNVLHSLCRDELIKREERLRFIITGAEKCSERAQKNLEEMFPRANRYLLYGSTEGAMQSCYLLNEGIEEYCVGNALFNVEVFAENDDGEELSNGEEGRLCAKTPYMMNCYLEDKASKSVIRNGVIKSDDLGFVKDGKVYVLGRMGNVIISGGYKINPYEVENAASSFEGVTNCVCVGKQNELVNQTVKLIVETGTARVDSKKLLSYLQTKLESYKVPKDVVFVEELKKNAIGKVDRKYYSGENK